MHAFFYGLENDVYMNSHESNIGVREKTIFQMLVLHLHFFICLFHNYINTAAVLYPVGIFHYDWTTELLQKYMEYNLFPLIYN